jgi:transposase
MRILKLKHQTNPLEIKEKMRTSKTAADYKRWQIIYMVLTYEVDAGYLSDTTGYSKPAIYSIIKQFNKKSFGDVTTKQKGGRRREYMSIEEEQDFMTALEFKAIKGQILTSSDIRRNVEAKLGRKVSDDYLWDLFKRNGWTKHSPRPSHPKKNEELQEDFKKNSKAIWVPLKMILNIR